jgi:hypothetical protein
MGLETASFINTLNSAWPLGTDSGTFGDNHLRLIKSVLKTTFPGSGGNGFSKQITATEDEINRLHGLNANIMDLINNATFPAGTILPFYNAAPPPGWTLVSQPTTRMLVVGGSTGHTTGGTSDPLLNNTVPLHSHSASGGTTDPAGDHAHNVSFSSLAGSLIDGGGPGWFQIVSNTPATTSTNGSHSHSLSAITINNNAGAADWTPRYLGLILCSKN